MLITTGFLNDNFLDMVLKLIIHFVQGKSIVFLEVENKSCATGSHYYCNIDQRWWACGNKEAWVRPVKEENGSLQRRGFRPFLQEERRIYWWSTSKGILIECLDRTLWIWVLVFFSLRGLSLKTTRKIGGYCMLKW